MRRRIEGGPELLRRGPTAVLYAIMDRVVDDYGPVVEGLQNDVDEIEAEVFGDAPRKSRAASTGCRAKCSRSTRRRSR